MYILTLLSILLCYGYAAKLPSQFKKCRAKDRDCLRGSVEDAIKKLTKGLPAFGLTTLDPLVIPEMTVGAGQNVVNVQQFYKNVKIRGISSITVTNFTIDIPKGFLDLEMTYPGLTLEAQYNMMGRILILPVIGNGNCLINLDRPKPTFEARFDVIPKNGRKYIKIKSQNYHVNAGMARYKFDNLFNGDEVLGKEINRVLNENWKEIYDEVVPGYEEAIGILLSSVANQFFSKVPISELFLPEKSTSAATCNILRDTSCFKTIIQDLFERLKTGDPELKIAPVDPLIIPELTIGAGEKVIQLTQNYKNTSLVGIGNLRFTCYDIDMKTKKIQLEANNDLVTLSGLYEFNGRVLLLPVKGKGPYTIKLENGVTVIDFDFDLYTKDKEQHLRAKNMKFTMNVQKVSFKFDNLFDGNKQLGDNINAVLNDNWKEVFNEMSSAYFEAFSQVLMRKVNKHMIKIPVTNAVAD